MTETRKGDGDDYNITMIVGTLGVLRLFAYFLLLMVM